MGIKGINDLIGGCKRVMSLTHLANKTCSVDASGFLYQFVRSPYYQRLHSNPILYGFLRQLEVFKAYNITPIYVFDGKPPKEKTETILERKKQKEKTQKDLDILKTQVRQIHTISDTQVSIDNNNNVEIINVEATTVVADHLKNLIDIEIETEDDIIENKDEIMFELKEKIRKKEIQSFYPTKEDIELTKELFSLLGVDFAQSSQEADGVLNVLIQEGLAEFSVSKDMDILCYDTPTLISSLLVDKEKIETYDLKEVLEHLEMTLDEFVDLCIMCGCDYVDRIPKIGPKTAYKLIKDHHNIEDVLNNLSEKFKSKVPDDYLEKVEDARRIFNNPHDIEYEMIKNEIKTNEEIQAFLNEHSLSTDILNIEVKHIPMQSKITDFYT